MAKKAKPKKVAHGTGVVEFICQLLRQGKTNQEILPLLGRKFPESRAGMSGISWCRNKLRKNGEKIKTNAEVKAARAKGKKKVDLAA